MLTEEQLRLQRFGPSVAPRDSPTQFASTFTNNLNLEVPARGDYVNSWDTPMDASLQTLDSAAGSEYVFATPSGGGTVTLTKAQAANRYLCIGQGETLSGDLNLFFPAIGGQKSIRCNLSGMGGHNIYIKGSSDTQGIVINSQNAIPWWPIDIIVYPWHVYWAGYASAPPGTIQDFAGGTIPPGWLAADGQTYAVPGGPSAPTGPYALLWAFLSGAGNSVTTPDYRGVGTIGADDFGTNGSAGRLGPWAGYGQGNYVGENAHVLGWGEMPVHNHGASDGGHQHVVNLYQSPHGHSDNGHLHYDSGHSHPVANQNTVPAGPGGVAVAWTGGGNTGTGYANIGYGYASITAQYANVGITAQNGNGAGNWSNLGYASISIGNAGSGGGHNNIQLGRTTIKLVRM